MFLAIWKHTFNMSAELSIARRAVISGGFICFQGN